MNVRQHIKKSPKSYLNWHSDCIKFASNIVLFSICGILFTKCASKSVYETDELSSKASASITTSNGEQILLNSENYGVNVSEDQLTYNDGTIINNSISRINFLNKAGSALYHSKVDYMVVRSPNNRVFHVVLPDSTKIWLSENSSLAIPRNFDKSANRIVNLSGEAYFDVSEVNVTSDKGIKKLPFTVLSKGQQTEVYGTKFNLNANPQKEKTTLFTGNLKITPLVGKDGDQLIAENPQLSLSHLSAGKPIMLLPNQSATLAHNKFEVETVSGQEEIEWDENDITFRNTTLKKILTIVATWYNVEVIYKTNNRVTNTLLGGSIVRTGELQEILFMLAMTANVKFKVNGDRVVVYK